MISGYINPEGIQRRTRPLEQALGTVVALLGGGSLLLVTNEWLYDDANVLSGSDAKSTIAVAALAVVLLGVVLPFIHVLRSWTLEFQQQRLEVQQFKLARQLLQYEAHTHASFPEARQEEIDSDFIDAFLERDRYQPETGRDRLAQ